MGQLQGRRVAVTGAAGFVGATVCRQLLEAGASVAALDVRAGGTDAGEHVPCDVTDAEATAAALAGAELVVHTAAIVTEWGEMDDFVAVNVRGTRNVLDGAEAAGAERVVHVSSVAVYGAEFRREVSEDEHGRPCGNPYVDTKWASERLARRRGATMVRPGDVYGPGSAQWLIRPIEGLRSRLFRIPGDGSGTITPVYIRYVTRPAGCHAPRAREVLGWEPEVTLEEGMRRSEAWLRESGRLS